MTMHYDIKGTGFAISDEVRSYVERQLSRVEKFIQTDPTTHVSVELQHAAGEVDKPYRAEFTITQGSHTHRAEASGESLHEAIDVASGELTNELSRSKDKKQTRMRRAAGAFKNFVRGWRN